MLRDYYKSWSAHLHREMEMLVFGHAGTKVLVFPTRGGRFFEFEEMRMPQTLQEKIDQGWLQFFCLDGIDSESFYCRAIEPERRIQRYLQYEKYILKEVWPYMESRNPHLCVIAYGCSLGAYQAANIAFRHPHLFRKLVAFSGRFDLTKKVEDFESLFDDHRSENIYSNTPTQYLSDLSCPILLEQIRCLDIILTIGLEDPFRESNEELSSILHRQGIPHQLHRWEGRAHRPHYWRNMAWLYL